MMGSFPVAHLGCADGGFTAKNKNRQPGISGWRFFLLLIFSVAQSHLIMCKVDEVFQCLESVG
jgi:hypothetical protein